MSWDRLPRVRRQRRRRWAALLHSARAPGATPATPRLAARRGILCHVRGDEQHADGFHAKRRPNWRFPVRRIGRAGVRRSAGARVRTHGRAMRRRGGCRALRCSARWIAIAPVSDRRWSRMTRQRMTRRWASPRQACGGEECNRRADHGAACSAPVSAGPMARGRGSHHPTAAACGAVGAGRAAGQKGIRSSTRRAQGRRSARRRRRNAAIRRRQR